MEDPSTCFNYNEEDWDFHECIFIVFLFLITINNRRKCQKLVRVTQIHTRVLNVTLLGDKYNIGKLKLLVIKLYYPKQVYQIRRAYDL